MRLRLGDNVIAEMAEILSPCSGHRRRGVRPRGAQVLRTLGTKRNPLPSRKARWAPSLAAFFYMRPAMPLPVGDGSLVPFPGPLFRLLAAPAHAHQQTPDMVGVVAN